ncbi:hypothetical protein HED63_24270 [Ochrobactrum cytisi]|nr:hypothetical protein [Brucella cytisi]
MQQHRTDCAPRSGGLEGFIRIGIINSLLHGILPTALRRFRELKPNIDWSLHELLPDRQEQALLNGDIDIGFPVTVRVMAN